MKSDISDRQAIEFFKGVLPSIAKAKDVALLEGAKMRRHFGPELSHPEISVIMTTKNRVRQTLFTLNSIAASCKAPVTQVVIVDDSPVENRIPASKLEETGLCIEYVTIDGKFWVNPCVNYNIGFSLIDAPVTVIQNAEVCHIGDVLETVTDTIGPKKYLVFDVLALSKPVDNDKFWNVWKPNTPLTKPSFAFSWYQHFTARNAGLHFLTAINSAELKAIGGFDLDYSMATCFDDPAFIDRIKFHGVEFVNIKNNDFRVCGVHQWHPTENPGMTTKNVFNQNLLFAKQRIIAKGAETYPMLGRDTGSVDALFAL